MAHQLDSYASTPHYSLVMRVRQRDAFCNIPSGFDSSRHPHDTLSLSLSLSLTLSLALAHDRQRYRASQPAGQFGFVSRIIVFIIIPPAY